MRHRKLDNGCGKVMSKNTSVTGEECTLLDRQKSHFVFSIEYATAPPGSILSQHSSLDGAAETAVPELQPLLVHVALLAD